MFVITIILVGLAIGLFARAGSSSMNVGIVGAGIGAGILSAAIGVLIAVGFIVCGTSSYLAIPGSALFAFIIAFGSFICGRVR